MIVEDFKNPDVVTENSGSIGEYSLTTECFNDQGISLPRGFFYYLLNINVFLSFLVTQVFFLTMPGLALYGLDAELELRGVQSTKQTEQILLGWCRWKIGLQKAKTARGRNGPRV